MPILNISLLFVRYSGTLHTTLTWEKINATFKVTHPLILSTIDLILSIPATSVECERGFSTMRRIKTEWRNQLNRSTLNDLMRIYLEGPDIVDFDPTPAIQPWFLAGVRKRCPDTVKPLNHDQAQKLVVEMVEESEEDTFFDMEDEI